MKQMTFEKILTEKWLQNGKELISVSRYGSKSSAKPWQLFQYTTEEHYSQINISLLSAEMS
jgi:hypothetical protein